MMVTENRIEPMAGDSNKGVLMLAAGIKGAIGSTLAAAVCAMKADPDLICPYLMTAGRFSCLPQLGRASDFWLAGWDIKDIGLNAALGGQGVLEKGIWAPYAQEIAKVPVRAAPSAGMALKAQVAQIKGDMEAFQTAFPGMTPVFVNLLPAGACHDLDRFPTPDSLYGGVGVSPLPDLAYVLAAAEAGVPVVNFSPNRVEIPAVLALAEANGAPVAGRDGKTGQTYFKVVLASALRARALFVNGWYSLNILGNTDGENLMDPAHAASKLENKTDVLEEVLGYSPGMKPYGKSAHKVRIDYYPPRGDAKEAWDVIDFEGIFGLPMSLRLNLQGRDSILAVPLVLDLSRWLAAAKASGRGGFVPELSFYFKKSAGDSPAGTFEEQLAVLDRFEQLCCSGIREEA